jgi:CHAT domain/Tetratricopeptide repeat
VTPGGTSGPRAPDVETRVRDLHARGVAMTAAARPAAGARLHRAGLRLLGWPGPVLDAALAARLLISLAFAESELGRTDLGLELLADAERVVAGDDLGVLLQQRGLLLLRTGRTAEVLPLLDAAVPLLAAPEHATVLMRTLLNRGVLLFASGRIEAARADLRRARDLALAAGAALVVAKAVHNLGVCELLAGDIPAALSAYAEAERGYRSAGPGWLPHISRERASVLLAAGLASEAGAELDSAIVEFRRHRLSHELAEAELARAQAALMAGELAAARRWAGAARRRFHRRGNQAWAALAELSQLRASWDEPAGRHPARGLAGTANELAGRLRKLGLADDAALADWLGVRALLAAGQVARARELAAELPPVRSGVPVENRLLHRLAAAELAAADGQRGAAFRQLRAGLATLQEHRSLLGSADLQAGTAALGLQLARTGLLAALQDGSPRLVYAWSERARAQAFRVRPVRPPADREVAEAVAELRALRGQAREAELAGDRDPAALRRCAELERWITRRNWQLRGSGQASAAASFDELSAALGERTLVSLMGRGDRLVALVLRGGTARMVPLGAYELAAEAQRRLLSDLDALAGRRLPERMAAVVHASLRRQVGTLSDELLAPLRPHLSGGELVLVPTMALTALPWGLLPDLRGRPVTVAPSATTWLTATRARRPRPVGDREPSVPLLVAGPGLTHAAPEVERLAGIYPGARRLAGGEATVPAALTALDGVRVAHFATHGHHDRENVLFSRLDLADGPLMAYDLQQLAAPPEQVILSACDVGRAVVRPGDELLGFTAALLYAGTAGVVSAVTRVPDEDAVRVMTGFHRLLAAGTSPAAALAAAAEREALSSFVCFGSG